MNDEEDLINQIKSLEWQIHEVIVNNQHLAPSTALTAVTAVLCQMIAALPEPHRSAALETSLESLPEGVEVFAEEADGNMFQNMFTMKERRFDA